MSSIKMDVEKFTGSNDFGLWRVKIRALLVQNGLGDAIKGALPSNWTEEKRKAVEEKAHSTIILCLGDKPLREVSREETVLGLWQKLEKLYLVKSTANRMFVKQKLLSFKMTEDRSIADQLDEFNKGLDDLENLDVVIDDEDKALMLLNALPRSFENFKDTLIFGNKSDLSLEDVQAAIRTKCLQSKKENKTHSQPEGLAVKYRKANNNKQRKPFNNKKFVEQRICYGCKQKGHIRMNCPDKTKFSRRADANVTDETDKADEDHEHAEVLSITNSKMNELWVLD